MTANMEGWKFICAKTTHMIQKLVFLCLFTDVVYGFSPYPQNKLALTT